MAYLTLLHWRYHIRKCDNVTANDITYKASYIILSNISKEIMVINLSN